MNDSNKPDSQEQSFDQWAEKLLANEAFLDRLFKEMVVRFDALEAERSRAFMKALEKHQEWVSDVFRKCNSGAEKG